MSRAEREARAGTQAPAKPDTKSEQPKMRAEHCVPYTLHVPEGLHLKIKAKATLQKKFIGQLILEIVEQHLESS